MDRHFEVLRMANLQIQQSKLSKGQKVQSLFIQALEVQVEEVGQDMQIHRKGQ